jgi:hypothetical protein
MRRRTSGHWITDDMAQALAAMCPPLRVADVLRAADRLDESPATPKLVVVDRMFGQDVDRVNLRKVLHALHALHDLRELHPPRR